MPLHVSSTCTHHQEVKIALHSLWYHHTYRCDDNRGCIIQFWPPDDEHMCSKHVEAWNKLIAKQKFCASSWLITEINILRCTVSKTSKRFLMSCRAVTLKKTPVPIVEEAGWASRPVSTGTESRPPPWDKIRGPSIPQPVAVPTALSRPPLG